MKMFIAVVGVCGNWLITARRMSRQNVVGATMECWTAGSYVVRLKTWMDFKAQWRVKKTTCVCMYIIYGYNVCVCG